MKFSETEKFGENLWNYLWGDKNTSESNIELNNEDKLALKLFNYYSEIEQSYDRLLDAEIYIKRFPFRNTRIKKVNYLEHQVTTYLNEVYILQERLKINLKIIEKCYKQNRNILTVKKQTKKVNKIISDSFKNIIDTRGMHIHEQSFSDPDLNQLMLMESFLEEIPTLNLFYRLKYNQARKKWKGIIEKNNKDTETVLIKYYYYTYPLVFNRNGKLIIPAPSAA